MESRSHLLPQATYQAWRALRPGGAASLGSHLPLGEEEEVAEAAAAAAAEAVLGHVAPAQRSSFSPSCDLRLPLPSPGFWGCSPGTALAAESGGSRHVLRRLALALPRGSGDSSAWRRCKGTPALACLLAWRNQLHLPGLK